MDVSSYEAVVWEEREAELCSTQWRMVCEDREQQLCEDVAETRCDVSLLGIKRKIFSIKTSLPYFGVKLSCVCLMLAYRKPGLT